MTRAIVYICTSGCALCLLFILIRVFGPGLMRRFSVEEPRPMDSDDAAVLHGYAPRHFSEPATKGFTAADRANELRLYLPKDARPSVQRQGRVS